MHQPGTTILFHVLNQRDPTRTTTLRNAFVSDMSRRFNRITRLVTEAIVEQDVFGLKQPDILQAPASKAFAFPRSADKVTSFMTWFQKMVDDELLQVGQIQRGATAGQAAWSNIYIKDSYGRGVTRARYQLTNGGFGTPTMAQTGGLVASLSTPFHADRLGLLFTRTFNELKGITAAMDQQVSRILAQGIAEGVGPKELARMLNTTITGKGSTLAIRDSLGRYIPAKRRGELLARTEIIRSHAEAQLNEFETWKVEKVEAQVEWITAGDNRVCAQCANLENSVFTIAQAHGKIPLHPQCRCMWIPAGKTIGLPDKKTTPVAEPPRKRPKKKPTAKKPAPKPRQPGLNDAKTVPEVETYLKNNWKKWTSTDARLIELTGMDLAGAKKVAIEIRRLTKAVTNKDFLRNFRRFTTKNIERKGGRWPGNVYAHANGQLLEMNPHYFRADNMRKTMLADFGKARNYEHGFNFHPILANINMSIESVVAHEFGHVLTSSALTRFGRLESEFLKTIKKIKSKYTRELNKYNKAKWDKWEKDKFKINQDLNSGKLTSEQAQERSTKAWDEYRKSMDENFPDYISGYASKNNDEFLAESFSAWEYGEGYRNNPYVIDVIEALKKLLNEGINI